MLFVISAVFEKNIFGMQFDAGVCKHMDHWRQVHVLLSAKIHVGKIVSILKVYANFMQLESNLNCLQKKTLLC